MTLQGLQEKMEKELRDTMDDEQFMLDDAIAFIKQAQAEAFEAGKKDNLGEELKKLYDSEINVCISSFWDGGWYVRLGDDMNGYKGPEWDFCNLEDIVPSLKELATKFYPNSTYAKNLKSSATPNR